MKLTMFNASRCWNRLAYWVINMGRKMVWDYTGRNEDILGEDLCTEGTKAVMTEIYSLDEIVSRPIMILCPDCGNKRCPKASDSLNDCTGSNEPGQQGSIY